MNALRVCLPGCWARICIRSCSLSDSDNRPEGIPPQVPESARWLRARCLGCGFRVIDRFAGEGTGKRSHGKNSGSKKTRFMRRSRKIFLPALYCASLIFSNRGIADRDFADLCLVLRRRAAISWDSWAFTWRRNRIQSSHAFSTIEGTNANVEED
jgi:hypothetical protein